MPAMKAYGYEKPDDQIRELFKILQRSTTQRFLGEGIMNVNQMLAEVQRMMQGQGTDAAAATQNASSMPVAVHNLAASFSKLETAIGGSDREISAAVEGINALSGAVKGVTEIARAINTAMPDGAGAIMSHIPVLSAIVEVVHALGWVGEHGEELQRAARSIHSIFEELASFLGRVSSLPSWLRPHSLSNDAPMGKPMDDPTQLFHRQSFIPPARSDKPTVLKSALNIDSHHLAEAISYALADMFENSPNAPTANGSSLAALNGWNPVV
jgi:hypothetical protein